MTAKIRVAVVTQDDSFVIPHNINLLANISRIDLVAVIRVDAQGSLSNKRMLFLRGFGIFQAAKMAILTAKNGLLDLVDGLFSYKLQMLKSLKSASRVGGAEFSSTDDPNSRETIDYLSELQVDLVVSYSAPSIFKSELLSLPALGCINLHCSFLPKYAGLLPSFWALYEDSDDIGATVHRMDSKIDNGAILGQIKVERPKDRSMFTVIKSTKRAGGELMVSVVNKLIDGNHVEYENPVKSENYYSWPTVAQIKSFRQAGGKLV